MAKKSAKKIKITKKWAKSGKRKIKAFIRKNKKISILIFAAVLLILSFTAYRIWLNVHFLITDDLILNLEPQDKSLSVHYWEKPNVSFSVDIENNIFCNAYCEYEFNDISTKTTLDNGTFTRWEIVKAFDKEFELSVGRVGAGQKIYSFDIECSNIRTWYCLTNENKRKRTAFVTLNYDLSEYEIFLKDTLKDNITKLVNELSAVDIAIQKLNNRFFELGFSVNLNGIEGDKEILNNDYNTIVLEFENLERVWSEEDYVLLSELFNRSYYSRISGVKQGISDINLRIDDIADMHNSIVNDINKLDNELRAANETVLFLNRAGKINLHKQLLSVVSGLKLQLQQNIFINYTFFELGIEGIKRSLENFENASNEIFMGAYLKGSYHLSLEKEKLCDIKGTCQDKIDFTSVINHSLSIEDRKIDDICLSLKSIEEIYEIENNQSRESLKNYNIIEIQNILENAKNKKSAIIKKNIFNEIKSINKSSQNNALELLINLSNVDEGFSEEIDYGNYSENEILALIQLNLSNGSVEYYKNYYEINQSFNISEYYGNKTGLNEVNKIVISNFSSRIDIKLTENYPICCVFGECKRCCTEEECKEDPMLYPVLFLHGHAFNSDNSPAYSLDAFNKIQTKLQEEGYISAGTITPVSDYSEINQGEWGLSSKPISVKGSYYLVSYYNIGSYAIETQKSENIETYAIRLKELIDLLKFRTGRDKVILISHSMGGLVARSYMQIFGDSSVDKLIMIAAPNKGITGQISSYCPILGEKKECKDMSADSIFIKKINDPLKTPKNAEIHNILGVGCYMGNETGDGIVTKANAKIDFAKNYEINGTCVSISKPLHSQILDINKYPEVYEIIRSILKES